MGTNTLTDKVTATTISPADVNDIHEALREDFVPRNSSGVATDLAGDLGTASLRWKEVRVQKAFIGGVELGADAGFDPTNRVLSGATRSSSNQPAYLDPAGTGGGASATLLGATTTFEYDVKGTTFQIINDLVLSGLTTAPSVNNTALVNDTDAADQASTRTWGEFLSEKESIAIDTAGSEITTRLDQIHPFKIDNGSETEFFMAKIESATELNNIKRGFFTDDSLDPVNRIVFSNNDVITFLQGVYIFAKDDSTLDTTDNPPTWSADTPTLPPPVVGDRWFDLVNNLWKRYNGASFVDNDETFVGIVILDDTDCVGARVLEFAAAYNRENNLILANESVTEMRSKYTDALVNIAGQEIQYRFSFPSWDITTDLATAADLYDATEQASRRYFLYLSDEGEEIISDIEPYYRYDLFGFYHPHNPWRAMGYVFNDSSSDFDYFSWFPGETYDYEVDYLSTVDTSGSVVLTAGAGYSTVPLNVISDSGGSGIDMISDQIFFRKRGTYRLFFKADFLNSTPTGVALIDVRLRDITLGSTALQFQGFFTSGNTNNNYHMAGLVRTFQITNLASTYEVQAQATTTTSTLSRSTTSFNRMTGLYIGKE